MVPAESITNLGSRPLLRTISRKTASAAGLRHIFPEIQAFVQKLKQLIAATKKSERNFKNCDNLASPRQTKRTEKGLHSTIDCAEEEDIDDGEDDETMVNGMTRRRRE